MFKRKKFIYCADAGLGSLSIKNFNSMGGRAFIVTQSIKKLSDTLKEAVFNDTDYRLLSSDDNEVSVADMKRFDKNNPANRNLYDDKLYKIVTADKAMDFAFAEEKYDAYYAIATNLDDSQRILLKLVLNNTKSKTLSVL